MKFFSNFSSLLRNRTACVKKKRDEKYKIDFQWTTLYGFLRKVILKVSLKVDYDMTLQMDVLPPVIVQKFISTEEKGNSKSCEVYRNFNLW